MARKPHTNSQANFRGPTGSPKAQKPKTGKAVVRPHRPDAKAARPPRTAGKVKSFAAVLKALTPANARQMAEEAFYSAPLAHLPYEAELAIKNEGLSLFWKSRGLEGSPEPIIASPRQRNYRTTSRRRTVLHGSTLYLLFGDKEALPANRKMAFHSSPLEPAEHEAIFRFLQQKLSDPNYRLVAGHLNHLIIRGSYSEFTVIFNVDLMNGPLVRKLKQLSVHLQNLPEPVTAAYIYLDPSRSEYYLEKKQPGNAMSFKTLYGPDHLSGSHGGCRYRYHPASFSQVNEAMVTPMLDKAREMLAPQRTETLLDLYCGYGLFTLFLAPQYRKVLGIEADKDSIQAAKANSRLNIKRGGNAKFLVQRVSNSLFENFLPDSEPGEVVLLDPPRQGPQAGVITEIGNRGPAKVLHIFCGVDQIPEALAEWRECGYRVQRVVPLDMFAGSPNLEILISLTPLSV